MEKFSAFFVRHKRKKWKFLTKSIKWKEIALFILNLLNGQGLKIYFFLFQNLTKNFYVGNIDK